MASPRSVATCREATTGPTSRCSPAATWVSIPTPTEHSRSTSWAVPLATSACTYSPSSRSRAPPGACCATSECVAGRRQVLAAADPRKRTGAHCGGDARTCTSRATPARYRRPARARRRGHDDRPAALNAPVQKLRTQAGIVSGKQNWLPTMPRARFLAQDFMLGLVAELESLT
jgi:hypothetical protein